MLLFKKRTRVGSEELGDSADATAVGRLGEERNWIHAFRVIELDVVTVDRDGPVDPLRVGLEECVGLTTGGVQLALGHRTRLELQHLTIQPLGAAHVHEAAWVHLNDDVSDDARSAHRNGHRWLFDDRGDVPATRVAHDSGIVELGVRTANRTACQIEHPELILLAGGHLGCNGVGWFEVDDEINTAKTKSGLGNRHAVHVVLLAGNCAKQQICNSFMPSCQPNLPPLEP